MSLLNEIQAQKPLGGGSGLERAGSEAELTTFPNYRRRVYARKTHTQTQRSSQDKLDHGMLLYAPNLLIKRAQ